MFQFLRRVSGSLLPRPDRPWRDDATSHAPTIGRKRARSVIDQDDDDDTASTAKKTKNEPIKPGIEYDPASEGESTKEDGVSPVDGQEVKEVTRGVKEVDLGNKDEVEDASSSIQPEGVPLPDSPSEPPKSEFESPEPVKSDAVQEAKDREHVDDKDSSALGDDADEEPVVEPTAASTDAPAEITPATVGSDLQDIPEALEAAKA